MKKFLVFVVIMVLGTAQLQAQDEASVPTDITSDKMSYFQQENKVIFEGNVVVNRPDFDLTSERLTVYFEESPQDSAAEEETGEIKEIVAEQSVRLEKDGRQGFCEKATYNARERVIVMEGNPVLVDGKNKVQGTVIKFFMADNRSEILGSEEGRVKARFFTPPADE